MPGELEGCHSFEHVAVSLVSEGGVIDRMAWVDAVLTVGGEGLCGSGHSGGQRRSGSLLRRWGGQLQPIDAEGNRFFPFWSRHPAKQDPLWPHLASQPGKRGRSRPGSAVSDVRWAGGFTRVVLQGNLIAQQAVPTLGELGR